MCVFNFRSSYNLWVFSRRWVKKLLVGFLRFFCPWLLNMKFSPWRFQILSNFSFLSNVFIHGEKRVQTRKINCFRLYIFLLFLPCEIVWTIFEYLFLFPYSFASLYLCRQDKMFTPFDVDFQFHSFTFPHQIVNTFQGLLFKSEAFWCLVDLNHISEQLHK